VIWLHFAGWFQCRLATDPDPADEPRGVGGYAHAAPGEPDLDRVIRLQPPGSVQRSYCPAIGVTVRSVVVEGRVAEGHPLVGASVDLLEEPVFEGRNGIVAEDGLEPIVPFVLEVAQGGFRLERRHADEELFPFAELQAAGVQPGLSAVAGETGIYDLASVWRERSARLQRDHDTSQEPTERAALSKRLGLLARPALARFFGVRMLYGFRLGGLASVEDPEGWLGGEADPALPWPIDFWLGGWDSDAFSGYMKGAVGVALTSGREGDEAVVEDLGDPDAPLRA
jgi:hypothetical protein